MASIFHDINSVIAFVVTKAQMRQLWQTSDDHARNDSDDGTQSSAVSSESNLPCGRGSKTDK